MTETKWDIPYYSSGLNGRDLLAGKNRMGNLVYIKAHNELPNRNAVAFCGTDTQKRENVLVPNIINSVEAGRSVVIISDDIALRDEFFDYARARDYTIKSLDFRDPSNSNHWNIFSFLKDENPMNQTERFIRRLCLASKINEPGGHQLNALGYLKTVLLYVRYSPGFIPYNGGAVKKRTLREFIQYFEKIQYDEFRERILKLKPEDPARRVFEYAERANNYIKWDVTSVSEIIAPLQDPMIQKITGTDGMSTDELAEGKCIYMIHPSDIYAWPAAFFMMYICDTEEEIDVYSDGYSLNIPFSAINTGRLKGKTLIAVTPKDMIRNESDIEKEMDFFGVKLAFSGCSLSAAEKLSLYSGIDLATRKFNRSNMTAPQDIISLADDSVYVFTPSGARGIYQALTKNDLKQFLL